MLLPFVLSLLCAAAGDAQPNSPRWSDSLKGDAERMITVEVVDGDRVTSVWQFPVKPWRASDLAARPAVEPVTRWFVARNMSGTKRKGWVFSQTWLAAVDAESASVAFEWYPSEKAEAKSRRLAKHVLRVPLNETAVLKVASRVTVRAQYSPL